MGPYDSVRIICDVGLEFQDRMTIRNMLELACRKEEAHHFKIRRLPCR
ncbi:hypothetical protein ACT91Q_13995 [Brevibacillus thermoruber]